MKCEMCKKLSNKLRKKGFNDNCENNEQTTAYYLMICENCESDLEKVYF